MPRGGESEALHLCFLVANTTPHLPCPLVQLSHTISRSPSPRLHPQGSALGGQGPGLPCTVGEVVHFPMD